MAAKATFDPILESIVLHEHDLDASTTSPSLVRNGQIALAYVEGEGRIYFRVDNATYYVTGTQVAIVPPKQGNPIGLLLALTYPADL